MYDILMEVDRVEAQQERDYLAEWTAGLLSSFDEPDASIRTDKAFWLTLRQDAPQTPVDEEIPF